MEKTIAQQVQDFRTSLPGVAAILGLNYRGIQPWTRAFKLAGRRSHGSRYGLKEIWKFRIVSLLSGRRFNAKEINAAFSALARMTENPGMFAIVATGDGVEVFRFDTSNDGLQRFVAAAKDLTMSGTRFCPLDLNGVTSEVISRIDCHVRRVPFVSVGEQVVQELRAIAAKNRAMGRPENWTPEKDKV